MLRLGFQPLLSSVKVCYFLLKSDGVLRLENRLPKRHGGSNPSSCAIKTNTIPRGWCLFLYHSQRGRTRRGSHTAGTQHTMRHRVFAVSASRGDVGLNLYRSGTIRTDLAPSSIPLFLLERILTPLCDSLSRRMGFAFERKPSG